MKLCHGGLQLRRAILSSSCRHVASGNQQSHKTHELMRVMFANIETIADLPAFIDKPTATWSIIVERQHHCCCLGTQPSELRGQDRAGPVSTHSRASFSFPSQPASQTTQRWKPAPTHRLCPYRKPNPAIPAHATLPISPPLHPHPLHPHPLLPPFPPARIKPNPHLPFAACCAASIPTHTQQSANALPVPVPVPVPIIPLPPKDKAKTHLVSSHLPTTPYRPPPPANAHTSPHCPE